MDEKDPTPSTRKVKFTPKLPSRRTPRPAERNTEDLDGDQTRELLRRTAEGLGRRGPRVERKAEPVEVVFGDVGATSIRAFGGHRRSSISRVQYPVSDNGSSSAARLQDPVSGNGSSSASQLQDPVSVSDNGLKASDEKKKKHYAEPWSYYSYYPVTLPLRRPYAGNPELLDEEEFGDASKNLDYDESSISPAVDLGLMEESDTERMLFLQLPMSLPFVKRTASAKGKEVSGSFIPQRSMGPPEKGCSLEELPAGFMGKMLVYKSGAIKLKLGETIYDVSPGSDCVFPQDVAVINTEEKHCCALGELGKRAIVTPDVDSLLK